LRSRIARTAATAIALAGLAAAAGTPAAAAQKAFHPRIHGAMGLMPVHGRFDVAQGSPIPAVYHGGTVMSGTVTVHTIFWAPAGYRFGGSPGAGVLGYEPLIQRFLTDAAHDSGGQGNVFSVLAQYGQKSAAGRYSIAYDPATDSIDDTSPYPRQSAQCPSPAGTATCVTDVELAREINRMIAAHDPRGYGLHDVWEVFLPPGVDECISVGSCGTNAFAGYHALADQGRGEIIYAVIIDPLIESQPIPGADPQGNPEAEASIDTAAHETVEAITDPEGVGWMDPNGYEVGDKCESGPQQGTPLGYAPDGSPYDQLINGHQYDIQTMWANSSSGCVQSSTATSSGLPLPSVSLRQFSPAVRGTSGTARAGVGVRIELIRAGAAVAEASTSTRRGGSWGPVVLKGRGGAPHGVGDDRDELIVVYGRGGPAPELIATGAGGDPFSESGWTGWLDLDGGLFLSRRSASVSPCGQTGVLSLTVDGRPSPPILPQCQTETDVATVALKSAVTAASRVVMTSADNRAVSPLDPPGAAVALSIVPGEPGSVSPFGSGSVSLGSGGLPACSADLRAQSVSCGGLVPGERYTLTRRRGHAVRHARADGSGTIRVSGFPGVLGFAGTGRRPLAGGDQLVLVGSGRRVLSTLHLAHLRVAINGQQTVVAAGSCQPGEYVGAPLANPASSPAVGLPGATGRGTLCPGSGRARGLPVAVLAETDDLSGGVTRTLVPLLEGTVPSDDAIVYGAFRALAQTGLPGPHGSSFSTGAAVSLSVTPAGSRRVVFRSADVAVANGAEVVGLAPGVYRATWIVRDLNGDTRTVRTRFVESG
jgi:hypothetical protein